MPRGEGGVILLADPASHPADRFRHFMDVLEELGLGETNPGAYNGEWLACGGELLESKNPATGEILARPDLERLAEALGA